MKEILQDLSFSELQGLAADCGEPKFRAVQLYKGLMRGKRISEISDIPKAFRERLLQRFEDEPVKVRTERKNICSSWRTATSSKGC